MKRILFSIFLCGMSLPMVMSPMDYDYNLRYCNTCWDNLPRNQFRVMRCCGGYIGTCDGCFREDIENNIQQRACHAIRCPNPNCRRMLEPEQVNQLVQDQAMRDRFVELRRAFIDQREAQRAAGFTLEKRRMIWSTSNTDACPRCFTLIQKNGGCKHMTCRPEAGGCGHEFCWHCKATWNGWHFCNPISVAHTNLLRTHPAKTALIVGAVAGVGYGAYRLYKHLRTPKPVLVKDLELAPVVEEKAQDAVTTPEVEKPVQVKKTNTVKTKILSTGKNQKKLNRRVSSVRKRK